MCGIVGCYAFNDFAITEDYLNPMRDSLYLRGPDGFGTWISDDKKIGFGHRRLSIIDLSEHAAQPMQSHCGNFVLTYNGEIYNHRAIRQELIELGVTHWRSDHSDTEVLLQAFATWGIECIEKFRGMFAFAIYDKREKTLWLVRDRIGIKPLYFSQHHQRLTFASEIKALLKDPDQPRNMNEENLFYYLSFLTTPAPDTLFQGIHKLACGTWMKINQHGDITTHKYWDVWDHTQPLNKLSHDDIACLLRQELETAVKLRKESDVPVGVFLSGGIDSSTNAALFAKDGKTINTFSIGYDNDYASYKNELHYAKLMADTVQANYHEKRLNIDDLISFLPEMVKLQDEPIADPVCVPVYYVAKLARDNGTIVCQVGEGADELFWGYQSWKAKLRLQQLSNIPGSKPLQYLTSSLLKLGHKTHTVQYELLRRSINNVPIFWGGAEAYYKTQKQQLLSPRLAKKFEHNTGWDVLANLYSHFLNHAHEKSTLNWMSYVDLNYRLPELLLMRVDKMCMGVSLEARVPFLDHKFVELAMSIPSKIKTHKGISKYILKKAVRGLIPDQLIDRKKQGFGVPVYEWFFDKLGSWAKTELNDFCKQTDYFNKAEIDKLIATKQGPQVWYLLNLSLWWKTFIS